MKLAAFSRLIQSRGHLFAENQNRFKLYLERVKEPVRKSKVLPQSPVLLQVVGLDQRRLVGDGRRVEGPAEGGEGGQGT